MAATINDRDILIMGGTRTNPVVLPPDVGISGSIDPNSEVAGTGVSMTDLIAGMGGGGDYTVEILQNSGTTVTVNSSTLFQMPGPGLGGTFIGGGGIIGRDTAGNTKVTINSNTGLLTAEDAIIHGTLQAGSIITNSVQISGSGVTMQQLVDSMGSTFDLQGALDAGVENILAGVGSDYRLDVDTANAFVAFRHKDAVYQGTAAAGSNKPALGISAAGLAMGYNQASNGQWVNAVAIESTGEISLLGTLKAGSIITNSVTVDGVSLGTIRSNAATGSSHASATGNVHNVSLTQIGGDLDDISDGSTYFRTTANQRTGGGRAFNALDSSGDYVRSLVSTKLTVVGSNPNTGWVGDSNGIRLYQSGNLRINLPVSGAPSFSGDITGGSNIDIAGQARFSGSSSEGGQLYTIVANPGGSNNSRGIWASSGSGINQVAILGTAPGSGGTGVSGMAQGSNGAGVTAIASGAATTALAVSGDITHSAGITQIRAVTINTGGLSVTGDITQSTTGSPSTTLRNVSITSGLNVTGITTLGTVSAGSFSSSSVSTGGISATGGLSVSGTSQFNSTVTLNGITKIGTGLVANLNADMVDGYHASALCNIVGCNTGTCTVSGNGFNMNVTITGFRSRGTGNNVIIEETSDVRLKQDIEPEELGLDFVNQLQPKTYRLKSDPSRRYHGFVADDIEQIIGREDDALFRVHPDGMKGSDYISLIAPLVKSIQQLSSKLDALEAQLN